MQLNVPDYWFIFQNDKLLLLQKENNKFELLSESFVTEIKSFLIRHHYVGRFNRIHCYAAELDNTIEFPPHLSQYAFVPLRIAFETLGYDWYGPAVKAYSVMTWDKNTQFCSRCGNKTIDIEKANTFEHLCPVCGFSLFPRISPSIIVMIRKGDEILMARSPHFAKGVFGLIAGFVELGESIEDAIHREVKEEVGLEINHLKYFGSQAWPFPDSLMLGFTAKYASGDILIDPHEIESAGWYRYDNLPGRPSHISIARKLIDHFVLDISKKKKRQ